MAENNANQASDHYEYLHALWNDNSRLDEFRDQAPAFVDDPATPPFYKIKTLMLLAKTGPNYQDGNDCLYYARVIWADCFQHHIRGENETVDDALMELEVTLDILEVSLIQEAEEEQERQYEAAREQAEAQRQTEARRLEQFRVAALSRMIQTWKGEREAKERAECLDHAIGMMNSMNIDKQADDETMNKGNDDDKNDGDDRNDGDKEKHDEDGYNNDAHDDDIEMM